MMTMTTSSSSRVNPAARNPSLLAMAPPGCRRTGMLIVAAPIVTPHCTQSSRPAKVGEHRMIVQGYLSLRRGSIRLWERVVGIDSIMYKRRRGERQMTRYIVSKQTVRTATGTHLHVLPVFRLPQTAVSPASGPGFSVFGYGIPARPRRRDRSHSRQRAGGGVPGAARRRQDTAARRRAAGDFGPVRRLPHQSTAYFRH